MTKGIDRNTLRSWQLAAGVVVLGIVGSVFLANQGLQSARLVEREQFIEAANAATQTLERRIDALAARYAEPGDWNTAFEEGEDGSLA